MGDSGSGSVGDGIINSGSGGDSGSGSGSGRPSHADGGVGGPAVERRGIVGDYGAVAASAYDQQAGLVPSGSIADGGVADAVVISQGGLVLEVHLGGGAKRGDLEVEISIILAVGHLDVAPVAEQEVDGVVCPRGIEIVNSLVSGKAADVVGPRNYNISDGKGVR